MDIPSASPPSGVDPPRIGPFQVLSQLGAGAMGSVYRAVHVSRGLEVALKVMSHPDTPRYREAFIREVQAVAGLNHPNIVAVYELLTVTEEAGAAFPEQLVVGAPCLVMELASHGTLREFPLPLEWEDTRRILLAILQGLAHAHAHEVVHLDLKPANVLISLDRLGQPTPRLSDFGIAHAFRLSSSRRSGGERPSLLAGTPAYMAPEQFARDWRSFGPWTDLYAFGCLAWQLITGTPPFSRSSVREYAEAHGTQALPELSPLFRIPLETTDWLRGLLEKSIWRRYQTAADAAYVLESLKRVAPLVTPRPASPPPEAANSLSSEVYSALFGGSDEQLSLFEDSLAGSGDGLESVETLTQRVEDEGAAPVPAASHDSASLASRVRPPPPPLPPAASGGRPLPPLGLGLGLYGMRAVPLVGREAEKTRLWEILLSVIQKGRTQLVLLRGNAGNGKSRLCEWLTTTAHALGASQHLYAGHSVRGGGQQALTEMIRHHLHCEGLRGAELIERLERAGRRQQLLTQDSIPQLQQLLELQSNDLTMTGPVLTRRPTERYIALYHHLQRWSRQRPLIVFLDDLQWGASTLDFIEFILDWQTVSPAPILLLGTLRTEALDDRPELEERLQQLLNRQAVTQLDIQPLPPGAHRTLINHLLGLAPAVVEMVQQRSGGNPLFAVELLRDFVQRGLLISGPDGLELRAQTQQAIPDSLHELCAHRLSGSLQGLHPQVREALELAAILGNTVDAQEWQRVCQLAELHADAELSRFLLESAWLLHPTSHDSRGQPTAWAFRHGLMRDSLERSARERGRAARLHGLCAEALFQLNPTPSYLYLARRARHLVSAGELHQALPMLLDAATQAFARVDLQSCRALLEDWEEVAARPGLMPPPFVQLEGQLLRCELLQLMGRLDDALEVSRACATLARRQDDLHRLAHARRLKGSLLEKKGNLQAALLTNQETLTLCERIGDRSGIAFCLRGIVSCRREIGLTEGSMPLFQRALKLYREEKNTIGQADILISLSQYHRALRRFKRSLQAARLARTLYTRVDEQRGMGEALRAEAHVYTDLEQWEEARAALKSSREIFEQLGLPIGVASLLNDLSDVERFRGNLHAALIACQKAITIFDECRYSGVLYARMNLALIQLRQQDFAAARQTLLSLRNQSLQGAMLLPTAWIDSALLTCESAEDGWEHWDERLAGSARLLDFHIVERDDAWPIELAGDLAFQKGHFQKAAAAWQLALRLWNRLNNQERSRLLESRLSSLPPLSQTSEMTRT